VQDQTADVTWNAGDVPVSIRFDDPYFSLENGLAETRHVFLGGNDLPARFRNGFSIAELGFGTGLNFLTAWRAWQEAGAKGKLSFTSFEAFPMRRDDMAKALGVFGELAGGAQRLVEVWDPAGGRVEVAPEVWLTVITGDARATLPGWTGQADAWFLDGFSPAKNPELWGEDILREVARHTAPGGTCATYTAAGFVRRGLDVAGFDVSRTPGYARKRHMTRGVLRP
jgi:tRNA U34 5-methylaminomethyl-2-thiouridine-forming methyltransferase MnmC